MGEAAEIEWRALTEMQICISGFNESAPYVLEVARQSLHRLLTGATDSTLSTVTAPSRGSLSSTRATWQGQTWTGVRWPASTWTDTRELIGVGHSYSSY